jgi:hypothetical protein
VIVDPEPIARDPDGKDWVTREPEQAPPGTNIASPHMLRLTYYVLMLLKTCLGIPTYDLDTVKAAVAHV